MIKGLDLSLIENEFIGIDYRAEKSEKLLEKRITFKELITEIFSRNNETEISKTIDLYDHLNELLLSLKNTREKNPDYDKELNGYLSLKIYALGTAKNLLREFYLNF